MPARWLLPEGIDEVLPPHAAHLESMRRRILDLLNCWGYELVVPPLVEYLESLLTGMGQDLDLQTFKLIDQLTGRLMGVRADMTPQVARIDAHRLKRTVPTRLCYLGPVLHTVPGAFGATRNPFQIGAELYGHAGIESDVEVLCLMIETLRAVGITPLHVDLGHMGIFQGLVERAQLDAEQAATLYEALQRKAQPEIDSHLIDFGTDPIVADPIAALPDLNGDASVLAMARRKLSSAPEPVLRALTDLQEIVRLTYARNPDVDLHVDLAELRGYHYHTGPMFAAYTVGSGQALAKGGRYDGVGKVFGRARPATGFSTDLKLLSVFDSDGAEQRGGIYAPWSEDPLLHESIAGLRRSGRRVIHGLPGQDGGAAQMGCDEILRRVDDLWRVTGLDPVDEEL